MVSRKMFLALCETNCIAWGSVAKAKFRSSSQVLNSTRESNGPQLEGYTQ
jgi:hypothetical protein